MKGTPIAPVVLTLPVPTPANGFKIFPLGACDPTGLDLGPGTDMAVSCRQGNAGDPLTVEILDRTNGTVRATVPIGGGDQIAYDAPTNRYYLAASRWTKSGLSSGPACTAASPCTPVLAIIDAASRTLVQTAFTGNNAHSVAVDPVTHQVYLPFSSSAAPAGCATCDNVPAGGVLVFQE
jgi:DNA-binding beta-propeller fold protein YncE